MEPCTVGGGSYALCGTLTVPEDPWTGGGRTIDLRVAVIPAEVDEPAGAVVFLAGGPGGAATVGWGSAARIFPEVHADRDIVLVDQRGTGGSNELMAPEPPEGGFTGPDRVEQAQEWVAQVLAELDADPTMYTTEVAVRDLEAVRAALGWELVDLYGGSYGATVAQYYLKRFPDSVRSVVLDGGTLLDVPIMELIAVRSQRVLDMTLDRCAEDPACAEAFPDLDRELGEVLDRLAREPVETDVHDPTTGGPVVVNDQVLADVIHSMLLSADSAAAVPALIHGAWEGGGTGDVAQRAAILSAEGASGQRLIMGWMIRCSEAWARDTVEGVRDAGPSYLAGSQVAGARNLEQSCPLMPEGVVAADDSAPVRSEAPVLLLNGDADPQDPPANVADAPTELPESLVVVVPWMGHTVGHIGCLPDVVAAFLSAGTVDGLDTSCVDAIEPPPFVLSA
jgi:pimeloyl-ACP methyl ester carboxylesterase